MGTLTVRAFLNGNAVRSRNSLDAIDHCSGNNSTVCARRSRLLIASRIPTRVFPA